jgi:hypothetical protein
METAETNSNVPEFTIWRWGSGVPHASHTVSCQACCFQHLLAQKISGSITWWCSNTSPMSESNCIVSSPIGFCFVRHACFIHDCILSLSQSSTSEYHMAMVPCIWTGDICKHKHQASIQVHKCIIACHVSMMATNTDVKIPTHMTVLVRLTSSSALLDAKGCLAVITDTSLALKSNNHEPMRLSIILSSP